jgi:hypothetical protein
MRWRLLLIVPLVGFLIGPLYAGRHPDFLGVAFFYWYELACTLVSIAITFLVFPKEHAPVSAPLSSSLAGAKQRFSRDPSIRLRPRSRARN